MLPRLDLHPHDGDFDLFAGSGFRKRTLMGVRGYREGFIFGAVVAPSWRLFCRGGGCSASPVDAKFCAAEFRWSGRWFGRPDLVVAADSAARQPSSSPCRSLRWRLSD